jgi:hypothetical protein
MFCFPMSLVSYVLPMYHPNASFITFLFPIRFQLYGHLNLVFSQFLCLENPYVPKRSGMLEDAFCSFYVPSTHFILTFLYLVSYRISIVCTFQSCVYLFLCFENPYVPKRTGMMEDAFYSHNNTITHCIVHAFAYLYCLR